MGNGREGGLTSRQLPGTPARCTPPPAPVPRHLLPPASLIAGPAPVRLFRLSLFLPTTNVQRLCLHACRCVVFIGCAFCRSVTTRASSRHARASCGWSATGPCASTAEGSQATGTTCLPSCSLFIALSLSLVCGLCLWCWRTGTSLQPPLPPAACLRLSLRLCLPCVGGGIC